jgi:hypothetical protein
MKCVTKDMGECRRGVFRYCPAFTVLKKITKTLSQDTRLEVKFQSEVATVIFVLLSPFSFCIYSFRCSL